MINRKELRIGNYITEVTAFDGFYASVVSIGADTCIYGVGYTALFDKLAPIPLTEKWLLDFGFENKEENWEKSDSNLWDFLIILDYESFMYSYSKLEIKHVHQLQNLYFALTGEELTLNP